MALTTRQDVQYNDTAGKLKEMRPGSKRPFVFARFIRAFEPRTASTFTLHQETKSTIRAGLSHRRIVHQKLAFGITGTRVKTFTIAIGSVIHHTGLAHRAGNRFFRRRLIRLLDVMTLWVLSTTDKNTEPAGFNRKFVTTFRTNGTFNHLSFNGFMLYQRTGVLAIGVVVAANKTAMFAVTHRQLAATLGAELDRKSVV